MFIRSVLESSCSVWHKSLTKENESDLERIQKTAFKLILGNTYYTYENAQTLLCLPTLKDRREELFTKFTHKSLKLPQMDTILRNKYKEHHMNTRNNIEKYKIDIAYTERLRKSAGIQMQVIANKY